MITGIAVHSSVWHYYTPTQFEITDHEILYKLIQIGRPGLAVPAHTMLCRPAIYRKMPVQSGANLTVYICMISGRVDLTHILYIFGIFLRSAAGLALRFLSGLPARSSRFGNT